jgi:hypothetical protein
MKAGHFPAKIPGQLSPEINRRHSPRKIDGPQPQSVISADDTKTIRKVVARLRDNDELEEFDLIYRSGRVKMGVGAGLDLIFPEEMKLLERLAGLGATS